MLYRQGGIATSGFSWQPAPLKRALAHHTIPLRIITVNDLPPLVAA